LHHDVAITPIAPRNDDMTKAKTGTFKGLSKTTPPANPPAGARRPAGPPPRLAVRTRASTKGR